jgi:hypothetical protein
MDANITSGMVKLHRSGSMRISVMIGFAILGMALLVGSGAGQGPDKKAKGFLPPGWKDLDLSADQKEKAYKILADYKTKLNDLKEMEKKLRAEEKTELGKLLTDAQKDKLKSAVVGETKKKDDDKK